MNRMTLEKWARLGLAVLVFGTVFIPVVFTATESQSSGSVEINPVEIQQALTEAGFYTGKLDGIIGPKTRAAIRAFQDEQGLKVDGVCGPKTWEKLKTFLQKDEELDTAGATEDALDLVSPAPYEDEDLDVLEEEEPLYEPAPDDDLKQKLIS